MEADFNGATELPKGWVWANLENLIKPSKEKVDPRELNKVSYLGLKHIEPDTARLLGRGYSDEVRSTKSVFRAGDLLYGKLRPYLNKVYVAEFDGICSTDILVFLQTPFLSTKYLLYRLLSMDFVGYANRNASGVQHPRVSFRTLAKFLIPLAPLPEQHRIVAKIEELFTKLDAGVESLKTAKMQLKAYRQSILKAAVEGKLTEKWREENKDEVEPASAFLQRLLRKRLNRWEAAYLHKIEASARTPPKDWKDKYKEPPIPDTSELPQLPTAWTWSTTSQICESINNGDTPSPDKMSSEGEIPFIKVYNLTKTGQLDFSIQPTFISRNTHEGELARSRIIPGDMLMNIVGPPLGKVSLVPPTYPEWNTNQAVVVFRPLEELSTSYLLTCLLSNFVLHRVISKARATAGQFNISLTMCRNLPIPLPPSTELEEIALLAGRVLSIIDNLDQTVDRGIQGSNKLRQAVLKSAFLGKLVPQDPGDEPASVLLERIKAQEKGYTGRNSEGRPSQAKIDAYQMS